LAPERIHGLLVAAKRRHHNVNAEQDHADHAIGMALPVKLSAPQVALWD
jgi:hypothetical protein